MQMIENVKTNIQIFEVRKFCASAIDMQICLAILRNNYIQRRSESYQSDTNEQMGFTTLFFIQSYRARPALRDSV